MPDEGTKVASTAADEGETAGTVSVSLSALEAVRRGALGRCPRCGVARLFPKFLKPIARCDTCGQDWTPQQADDFPAYVAIFVTGHLLAPLIIVLVKDANLSVGVLTAVILPFAIVMMMALIQPAKGAIIAIQWWFSMHGFERSPFTRD